LSDLNPERDTICGTPNYISPEMINKEPYGLKADCWAYGCILYAMAVGNPPFEVQKYSMNNILRVQTQMKLFKKLLKENSTYPNLYLKILLTC
jgi:serine/threonine protein kinase